MPKISRAAARAARREQDKDLDPNVFELDEGIEFELVRKLPIAFLIGLGEVQHGNLLGLREALEVIFVDPADVDKALRAGIDEEDLEAIASEMYGLELGEASASGSSSSITSGRSRPTSAASIPSSSRPRSGAKKRH